MENGWSTEIRFQRSPLQDPPAGAGELLQGTARGHLAEHGHGLDAADVGPLPLGDGVEPKDLARLPAGLQQGPCGPGHVDGLGVGEDEQRHRGAQDAGALGAEVLQCPSQVRAPPVEAGGAHIIPESVHILQGKGVHPAELLGEEEGLGGFRNLAHRLEEAQGEFGELEHGPRHVAEQYQPLPLLPPGAVGETVEGPAGLQAPADGALEVQLAAVAAAPAGPAELRVQLTGNGGDQGRGPGDVRLPKLGDVPVQERQVRVQGLAPHGGVLHGHLLFQEEAHEDGADEVAVELGIAL